MLAVLDSKPKMQKTRRASIQHFIKPFLAEDVPQNTTTPQGSPPLDFLLDDDPFANLTSPHAFTSPKKRPPPLEIEPLSAPMIVVPRSPLADAHPPMPTIAEGISTTLGLVHSASASTSSAPPPPPPPSPHMISRPRAQTTGHSIAYADPPTSVAAWALPTFAPGAGPAAPPIPPPFGPGRIPQPAYARPAFQTRPSLPSLRTLTGMGVVLRKKVRKGRVGAGLPFEPWDSEDIKLPPRCRNGATKRNSKHGLVSSSSGYSSSDDCNPSDDADASDFADEDDDDASSIRSTKTLSKRPVRVLQDLSGADTEELPLGTQPLLPSQLLQMASGTVGTGYSDTYQEEARTRSRERELRKGKEKDGLSVEQPTRRSLLKTPEGYYESEEEEEHKEHRRRYHHPREHEYTGSSSSTAFAASPVGPPTASAPWAVPTDATPPSASTPSLIPSSTFTPATTALSTPSPSIELGVFGSDFGRGLGVDLELGDGLQRRKEPTLARSVSTSSRCSESSASVAPASHYSSQSELGYSEDDEEGNTTSSSGSGSRWRHLQQRQVLHRAPDYAYQPVFKEDLQPIQQWNWNHSPAAPGSYFPPFELPPTEEGVEERVTEWQKRSSTATSAGTRTSASGSMSSLSLFAAGGGHGASYISDSELDFEGVEGRSSFEGRGSAEGSGEGADGGPWPGSSVESLGAASGEHGAAEEGNVQDPGMMAPSKAPRTSALGLRGLSFAAKGRGVVGEEAGGGGAHPSSADSVATIRPRSVLYAGAAGGSLRRGSGVGGVHLPSFWDAEGERAVVVEKELPAVPPQDEEQSISSSVVVAHEVISSDSKQAISSGSQQAISPSSQLIHNGEKQGCGHEKGQPDECEQTEEQRSQGRGSHGLVSSPERGEEGEGGHLGRVASVNSGTPSGDSETSSAQAKLTTVEPKRDDCGLPFGGGPDWMNGRGIRHQASEGSFAAAPSPPVKSASPSMEVERIVDCVETLNGGSKRVSQELTGGSTEFSEGTMEFPGGSEEKLGGGLVSSVSGAAALVPVLTSTSTLPRLLPSASQSATTSHLDDDDLGGNGQECPGREPDGSALGVDLNFFDCDHHHRQDGSEHRGFVQDHSNGNELDEDDCHHHNRRNREETLQGEHTAQAPRHITQQHEKEKLLVDDAMRPGDSYSSGYEQEEGGRQERYLNGHGSIGNGHHPGYGMNQEYGRSVSGSYHHHHQSGGDGGSAAGLRHAVSSNGHRWGHNSGGGEDDQHASHGRHGSNYDTPSTRTSRNASGGMFDSDSDSDEESEDDYGQPMRAQAPPPTANTPAAFQFPIKAPQASNSHNHSGHVNSYSSNGMAFPSSSPRPPSRPWSPQRPAQPPATFGAGDEDDDVPLARRIPTALKAQKSIRKQVREERAARKERMERDGGAGERERSRVETLRPAGAGGPFSPPVSMSSSSDAAIMAVGYSASRSGDGGAGMPSSVGNSHAFPSSMGVAPVSTSGNGVRQRTLTMPSRPVAPPSSAPFSAEDLAQKLQGVQISRNQSQHAATHVPAIRMSNQQQQQQQQHGYDSHHQIPNGSGVRSRTSFDREGGNGHSRGRSIKDIPSSPKPTHFVPAAAPPMPFVYGSPAGAQNLNVPVAPVANTVNTTGKHMLRPVKSFHIQRTSERERERAPPVPMNSVAAAMTAQVPGELERGAVLGRHATTAARPSPSTQQQQQQQQQQQNQGHARARGTSVSAGTAAAQMNSPAARFRSLSVSRGAHGAHGSQSYDEHGVLLATAVPPVPAVPPLPLTNELQNSRKLMKPHPVNGRVSSDAERERHQSFGVPPSSATPMTKSPVPPHAVLPSGSSPAAAGGVQHRVFIKDMQRFNMVAIAPHTTAGDVVEVVEAQGSLQGLGDGPNGKEIVGSGWMVWEVVQDFGMERPIRAFELLSDVQASWNKEKMVNLLVLKTTPFAVTLSRAAIPSSSPIHGGYVEWESKRGKWSKRWMSLREHSLWLSKRDNGKDEVFLCSLSNFDAYLVTRNHRAPKPFCFAVKSTDNLSYFENAADYLHTFACNEKEGRLWVDKILIARSYVLHQERQVLFNPKAAGGNASGAISRHNTTVTRKQTVHRPSGTAPLVAVPPPYTSATQSNSHPSGGVVFEPGSLLHRQG